MMLSKEERDRVVDYFESWELVEFLRLDIADVVEFFEDEIEDKLTALNELMGIGDTDDAE